MTKHKREKHFGSLSRKRLAVALQPVFTVVATTGLAPIAAQADEALALEEIVVTARDYVSTRGRSASKTDAPLVEIPQSVTVISRDQIDLLNWSSLNESVRYTAGATGEAFGPDERYDWLRVRAFDPVQFIDGVQAPIGSVNNSGTELYGSESVEVLKGPNSVLYGQTPPGGIVNMTSRRPEPEFSGEVEVQAGEYDLGQINGDVTGALNDTVSGRFTALYRDRGTQVDDLESRRLYLAPALTFDLSDRLALTLLANYQRDDLENQSTGFLPAYGTVLPNPVGKISAGTNLGEKGYNYFDREQYSAGYELVFELNDWVTVEQNLKYFDVEVRSAAIYATGLADDNADGVPDDFRTVNRSDFPFNEDISSFNVDTRANLRFDTGPLTHNLLAGVDYRRYDGYSEYGFIAASRIDIFNPVYDTVIPDKTIYPSLDAIKKQTGAYIQDQIHLGRMVLTVSGRQDWLDTQSGALDEKQDEFSYRAGINYVFDNGFAPYLQIAESFQPLDGADQDGNLFDPTTGTQHEIGLKYDGSGLTDDLNLFATVAAYEIVQENIVTPHPDIPLFSVQSGEIEVSGVEVELVARFRERFTVNAAATTIDTEVTRSNGADLGKELRAVPDLTASLLADYTFQSGPLAGLGAGIGVRYRGEQYGDTLNEWQSDAVTLWDAIVHYDTENWRFALNANNFTDKVFVDRCSSFANCFYGTRRLVTASATRKF